MSENLEKIIKIFKKKDKRFWLMIFVVFSTLSIFIIWALDFKNIFFINNKKTSKSSSIDVSSFKQDIKSNLGETLGDFSKLFEDKMNKPLNEDNLKIDIKKMESAINDKIKEEKEAKDIKDKIEKDDKTELEKTEENIDDLKKRIEELEKKLEK